MPRDDEPERRRLPPFALGVRRALEARGAAKARTTSAALVLRVKASSSQATEP